MWIICNDGGFGVDIVFGIVVVCDVVWGGYW